MISVVFITFNRSQLLLRAIASLRPALEGLGCPYELIVADDCSDPEHLEAIRSLEGVTLVQAVVNSGLGANANAGLRACRGEWILQVQDDWEYAGNSHDIARAIDVMEQDSSVGIVQLTPVHSDLPSARRESMSGAHVVFANDGLPWRRACNLRPYSDCPHIKRREFVDRVGPYLEGVPMTVCESDYQRRVSCQRTWRVAQLLGSPLFVHLGEAHSLNPGGRRHPVVKLLHSIPIVGGLSERCLRWFLSRADHVCAVVCGYVFMRERTP